MKFRTSLTIDECRSRLESAVDAERFAFPWSYTGSRAILGKIRQTSFRLQVRRSYQNSFAPFFYGEFKPVNNGTLVEGEFKMHPSTRVFIRFWFLFLLLFTIAALILPSRGQPESATGRVSMLLVAAFLGAFGIGLVKVGQRFAHGEQQTLTAFLKRTLEASDVA